MCTCTCQGTITCTLGCLHPWSKKLPECIRIHPRAQQLPNCSAPHEVNAVGVCVRIRPLHAHIVDADLGVRHTTAIAALGVRLPLALPVATRRTCTGAATLRFRHILSAPLCQANVQRQTCNFLTMASAKPPQNILGHRSQCQTRRLQHPSYLRRPILVDLLRSKLEAKEDLSKIESGFGQCMRCCLRPEPRKLCTAGQI
jgi:hypothetical protein